MSQEAVHNGHQRCSQCRRNYDSQLANPIGVFSMVPDSVNQFEVFEVGFAFKHAHQTRILRLLPHPDFSIQGGIDFSALHLPIQDSAHFACQLEILRILQVFE